VKEISKYKSEVLSLKKLKEGKKEDEVPQEEKDLLKETENKISELEEFKRKKLEAFGTGNELAKQLVDLALLANNMLRGEALNNFVKRSVEIMK
jgi:molecular chaperone HtpG